MNILLRTWHFYLFHIGFFFILCVSSPVFGQEIQEEQENKIENDIENPEEKPNPTEETPIVEQSRVSELITNSLNQDIDSSRRDELVAWNTLLSLPITGSDDELKEQLRTHYNLEKENLNTDKAKSNGNQFIIDSAQHTEYFTVKLPGDNEESVVKLTGNVVLSFEEKKYKRTHRVQADSIIFNEGEDKISALGNIEYIVNNDGREERFTGDSLIFEVDEWTGIIFHGTSERKEKIDGKEIPFFFRGKDIKRPSSEVLVLTDGKITSHDSDTPDYSFDAKKIWITGQGEWGLLSATIYVGHIPVLYMPFYWKSGNELFFTPVMGMRPSVGYYVQTTTYFIGRKKDDDSFSMLGFGDSADGDYDLVRDGLYLVKKERIVDEESEDKNPNQLPRSNDGRFLKFTLDGYTGLGAAAGISGDFPKLWDNGSLKFYASLGVSRSIDDAGQVYFNSESSSGDHWNNSYIGATSLPFRWGSNVDFKFGQWKLYMDWYSDPYYMQDFSFRKENFDWLTFILSEETDDKRPSVLGNLRWEISGNHTFKFKNTSPWIPTLTVNHLKSSLIWDDKNNEEVTLSTNPDKNYDPARRFFFPQKMVLPDLKFSVRGSFPALTVKRIKEKKEIETDAHDDTDSTESSPINNTTPLIGKPNSIKSFESIYNTKTLNATFGYNINSQFYIENTLKYSEWKIPEDIKFEFSKSKINTVHLGDFNYGMVFWDNLLSFTGKTNLSGYYQTHENIFGEGDPIEDTTKLEDYRYSKFLWVNTASLELKPLQGLAIFSNSSLKYSIDANIYEYKFLEDATVDNPQYEGLWIKDKDDLNKHEAFASLVFGLKPISLTTSLKANVPPLDEEYTIKSSAGFDRYGFKFNASQENTYKNDEWTISPLNLSASWLGWKDELKLSQSVRIDLEENRVSNSESTFKIWGFQTRFVATYGYAYKWDNTTLSWINEAERLHPSALDFSYNRTFDLKPFWKNRVKSKTVLNISWKIDLNQSTSNVLKFNWIQEFKIYKFTDIKLSFSSTNKSMYLYFPWWRSQLGIDQEFSFFEDLLQSFNIFNDQDRLNSSFNMDEIKLDFIHHLRSWDLTLSYSGKPTYNASEKVYDWISEFSIFIQWNPFPIFNQNTKLKDEEWTVESFGDSF